MKYTFSFFFISLLIACNSTFEKTEEVKTQELQESKKDTLENPYFQIRIADSLLKDKTKKEVLLEVVKRFKGEDLDFGYVIDESNTSYLSATVKVGKFFDDEAYYAIIYTNMQGNTDIDVYKLENCVVEHKMAARDYYFLTDTIFDVNGDGTKDFLVEYYPLSGCCRRESYDIYLSPVAKKELVTSYIVLINPTFYPQEKLVRGVEYGHPGWAGLYKYCWRGEKLDTLEYIYPDPTSKGRTFIKTQMSHDSSQKRKKICLSSLPEEYKTVKDLDWFLLYDEGTFDSEQ